MPSLTDIRNVAVIAHVDHGKTTLVDALLKQTHTFRDNQEEMTRDRIMDSNDLEREKGITILSKNTSVVYKGVKINIIDTPGHADFGGEVERILNMADAALLIVDAAEGPLSQTKFVLKKALEAGLKVILVINKIDRKDARVAEVIRDSENLFLTLAGDDDALDFPIVYAIGREGKCWNAMPSDMSAPGDTTPLFETILKYVPNSMINVDRPFQMQISAFEKNEYLGNLALGRIIQGKVKKGDFVSLLNHDQKLVSNFKIEKMFVNEGIQKVEASEASSGEVIYVAGNSNIKIGQTITDTHYQVALKAIEISKPTIKASFGPNTGIFAKDEAKFLTSRELKERLAQEMETNLGMKIEVDHNDSIRMIVAGRGELHLAILIEKLRREGYALDVGKPEVIYKEVEGKTFEPFTEVTIVVDDDHVGVVTSEMGKRKGLMLDMTTDEKYGTKMIYKISERNALGLRSRLIADTRGMVSLTFLSLGYEPKGDGVQKVRNGVIITDRSGKALAFGLNIAQKRGITFIAPTEDVYEGQIVGLRPVEGDLEMNICKGKQLTNMRSSGNDDAITLAPAVKYSIEEALDFIENDELIDITPKNVRLRKKYLTKTDRVRNARKL